MIRFENVTKIYKGSIGALADVTADIGRGEFVFLVGPSGSGKTTFLRLLLREELPDTGTIFVAGRDIGQLTQWRVPYLRRNLGCVFQDFRLLPNKTVGENVAFALEVIGRSRQLIGTQVAQVLELVGLGQKADRMPAELSGGEQQRVAIARAFVNRPLVLLADEPTGNLDPATSAGIMRLLDRINRTGTTIVMATHDVGIVDMMRRRVIELDHGHLVRDQARGVYGVGTDLPSTSRGIPAVSLLVPPTAAEDDPHTDRVAAVRRATWSALKVALSVEYVAKETASNLWRNRVMALAAVLTVAVSLSLVGTALLLRQAVNRQVQQWSGNVSLQIFMKANATQAETNYVTALTKQMSAQIRACTYLDHQASYNLAKQLFAGQQGGQAIISTLTPATTPPVFRCQLVNPNDAGSVAAIFYPSVKSANNPGVPGVLSAPYPGQSIKALERLTNVLQLVLLVIAIVLLASSLVLILNAIRMAIFARRQEIGVMKLVGATNWFIRLPFMAEGLLQGLVGALVAVVVVLLANVGVHSLVTHYAINALSSLALPAHELVTTEVLVVVVGVVIGALGSSVAVRRFLDV